MVFSNSTISPTFICRNSFLLHLGSLVTLKYGPCMKDREIVGSFPLH